MGDSVSSWGQQNYIPVLKCKLGSVLGDYISLYFQVMHNIFIRHLQPSNVTMLKDAGSSCGTGDLWPSPGRSVWWWGLLGCSGCSGHVCPFLTSFVIWNGTLKGYLIWFPFYEEVAPYTNLITMWVSAFFLYMCYLLASVFSRRPL